MIIYYQDNQDCMFAANIIYNNREKFCDDTSNTILVNYKYSHSDITRLATKDHTVIVLGVGFFKDNPKSIARLTALIENSKRVIWIDGHDNTEDLSKSEFADKMTIRYYPNMSTSWIVHYALLKEESNYVVDLVSEFQTRRIPSRAAINLYLFIMTVFSAPDDEVWTTIYRQPDMISELLDMGSDIYHFVVQQNVNLLSRRTYTREFEGIPINIINTNYKFFLPEIIEKFHGPILFWLYDGRVYRYVLYACKSDIDCLSFTSKYFGYGKTYKSVFVSKTPLV